MEIDKEKCLVVEYDDWTNLIELLHYMSDHGLDETQLDYLHDVLEYRPNHPTHPRTMAVYLEESTEMVMVAVEAYGHKACEQWFEPSQELLDKLISLKGKHHAA